jgi:DNA-directed RNA polymerase subunit RPC12/RpoP
MSESFSILLCQSCGWKKVCKLTDSDLKEIKNDSMSSRKFRCQSCGRGVAPRNFPDPQGELNIKSREESLKSEMNSWIESGVDFQRKFIEDKIGKEDNDQGH